MSTPPPRFNAAATLWAITLVIGLGLVANGIVPSIGILVIVPQVLFALLHGARRYGWRAIWVFVAAGLLISNFLENLAIEVGFPFGNYHYTGGGKLLQVP